ncbi:TonB-linked SusC/RagA family outer membrane protein [Salinibacter ruber]|nr:SusC/RagA family TonB-linked outer membrane protein [Salinibacter ruber]MCS4032994.1 TonB-linked SusC/RagA family outer membrane protein [Salinibacter ruber]
MKRLIPSVVFGLTLLLLPGLAWAQQGAVTGTVTEAESGNPLPGATVQIPDLETGAATDASGQYRIVGVPEGEQTIRVTFVGYETQERTVNVPAGGTTRVNFQLARDFADMEEVVVRAYGEQERERITGSVSKVEAQQIEGINTANTKNMLQGTAGVTVTNVGGLAGQAVNVNVRGASTLTGGSQPLYVVDGQVVTSTGGTGGGFGTATDPLSTIEPSNIASMEVLKGPSATALYGSRGANGVVLINTKEGRAGDLQISANFETGTVDRTRALEDNLTDGPTWARLIRERFVNAGSSPGSLPFPTPEEAQNYEWAEAVQRTGVARTGNISFRGGDDDTQFFLSGTWSQKESYVITNRFDRMSGRLNITQDVKDWIRVGANTSITRTQNFQAGSDNLFAAPLTSASLHVPVVPIRNDDGSLNLQNTPFGAFTPNPVFVTETNDYSIKNWRILASPFVEMNPIDNLIEGSLSLRAQGGIDALIVDDYERLNSEEGGGVPTGFGAQSYDEERKYSLRGTATYARTFASRHDVDLLVGGELEDSRRQNAEVSATGFPSFQFKTVDAAASPSTTDSEVTRIDGLASFFTRLTYTLDDKYTIEGSIRRDGSSRFGEDKRWGTFGSASFAYNLHRESFMQDIGFVSNLKLRGAWGLTGSNQLDGFFSARTLFGGGANYNEAAGVSPTQLGDPALQWESKRTLEGGFDLGLFNDRIFASATYYNSNNNDLILDRQLPLSSGFGSITQNLGELTTQGVELSLETQNIVTESFQWTTSVTASWQDEEVQELVGGDPIISGAQRAIEGESIKFNIPIYEGVDPQTGLAQYRDRDGGTTNSPTNADNYNVGNVLPSWTGSFGTTAQLTQDWGGIDFRAQFNFRTGNDILNGTKQFLYETGANGGGTFNMPKGATRRWQEPGDQTSVPQLGSNNSSLESTRFLEDGDFIRLKSITLGYSIPSSLAESINVDNIRVYFQGNNLLTFDELSFGDPEGSQSGARSVLDRGELFFTPPQQLTLSGGIDLQF